MSKPNYNQDKTFNHTHIALTPTPSTYNNTKFTLPPTATISHTPLQTLFNSLGAMDGRDRPLLN
jgi:hypothetical protein